MEEQTSNKIGTFVSSAVNRILNLVMILVIISLVTLVAWFWHNNQLLEQKVEGLQDEVKKFEKINLGSEDMDVAVKKDVEENIALETVIEEVDVKVNDSKSNEINDISKWKTYKNEKYGFEVKYPNNWKVETFKTYSQFPDLGPIDCNQTPEICKFEMIKFSNDKIEIGQGSYFGIRENDDAKKDYDEIIKNSTLMKDMIDGCLITYSISLENKGFLMHTFLPGDLIQNENEKIQFQKKCENNELESIADLAVETFKIY